MTTGRINQVARGEPRGARTALPEGPHKTYPRGNHPANPSSAQTLQSGCLDPRFARGAEAPIRRCVTSSRSSAARELSAEARKRYAPRRVTDARGAATDGRPCAGAEGLLVRGARATVGFPLESRVGACATGRQSRSFSCAKFISSSLPSTGHGAPPRPLNAPVTPPATNATIPRKSGLGKGVVGGGAAVVASVRSPRRPRLINCAPRARRRARIGDERARTTRDDGRTNGRPSGGRLPRVSREGTAPPGRSRSRGRSSA